MPYVKQYDTIQKMSEGRKVSNMELGMLAFTVVSAIVTLGTSDLFLHGLDATATVGTNVAAQHATTFFATQATVTTATTFGSFIPAYATLQHSFSLFMPIATDVAAKAAGMALYPVAKKAVFMGLNGCPILLSKHLRMHQRSMMLRKQCGRFITNNKMAIFSVNSH